MAPSLPLLAFFFFLSSTSVSAFNITKILDRHPGFGAFNSYLTQTHLAEEINRRQTITVLAVDDGAAAAVAGQPLDVIKKILSVHVILDYYDATKLQNLHKKNALVTTLFQSTGLAVGQTGFLNVTVSVAGVSLSSAAAAAAGAARLLDAVAAQPYNISVLHVSAVIVPPGIQNTNQTAVSPPPPPPPAAVQPPAAAPPTPPPTPSPAAFAQSPENPAAVSPSPEAPPPETAADVPAADNAAAPAPADRSAAASVASDVATAAALLLGCLLAF
ncbi:fasciclin-like arabinogalactan protein 14 [Wolffia australiana]